MVLPGSALPLKVGVLSLVTLPPVPATNMDGVIGVVGGVRGWAGVAGRVGDGGRDAVGAVVQRVVQCDTPVPVAVSGARAGRHAIDVDGDGTAWLGRAGEGRRIVVGDVAARAAQVY